ncbi:MAG TPA: TolC family protein [Bacteroidia bacterium]|nr:TolC family protein [Bacteroidia bacterium]
MIKKISIALLFLPVFVSGQSMLSSDEALRIGLKNNFDILIAKNQAEADSILNTAGEAGMLPSVSLNATALYNNNDIHQKYSSGNEITKKNVVGTTMNPGVALSWTLFDGTKMFVTRNKLEQIDMLGQYQFKEQVLNTTSDILLAYYDVVKQNLQLSATDEIIKFNEERVAITESRFTTGLGPKTDLLQAKIDLNVEKENRINLDLSLSESKRKLNTILGRDVNLLFIVEDSIPLSPISDRASLEQKMYAGNPTLLAFKTQVEISKLAYRETKTQYYPKVTLVGGYTFNQSKNAAGFTLLNQAYGWQTGLTLSMPIYQAGRLNHQAEIAQLNVESSEYKFQQETLAASLSLQNALAVYDSRTKAFELEKENEAMSRENMNLALERLRLGEGTALDVAQAQATLSSSLFRVTTFSYDLKSAEINVHRQAADL